MYGERYFATRERLAGLVSQIRALAEKSGARKNLQEDAIVDFLTPIQILVCGAVNAGKSTFLNALFGKNYCETNQLPETKKFYRYGYADTKSTTQTAHALEYHLPEERLKNFHFIDSPRSWKTHGLQKLGIASPIYRPSFTQKPFSFSSMPIKKIRLIFLSSLSIWRIWLNKKSTRSRVSSLSQECSV